MTTSGRRVRRLAIAGMVFLAAGLVMTITGHAAVGIANLVVGILLVHEARRLGARAAAAAAASTSDGDGER
jgi:hypothetical protein